MVLDVDAGSPRAPRETAGVGPAGGRVRAATEPLRQDIQGLRVVAVMLVVLFHLWPNRITGGYVGVDVFFVISGFLITSHLVRHPPTTGTLLAAFWARRIRRLLPASLLVLLVTLVASRLVAPEVAWAATAREVVASALYVENWSLASKAVDYLGADAAATPVQHFWSLSTEEQFYLVWPLLVGALVLLHGLRRGTGRGPSQRLVLGTGMALVVLASLLHSVDLTASDPARAYFVTPTRAWEFGAGGLVAILAGSGAPALGALGRTLLSWGGLVAIVVSGVWFTSATPFPGSAALLPVLGTVAVIAAAADGPGSPAPLWRLPGVQWVGAASYSIYLWHWPMIVLLPALSGSLGRLDKAVILVLTFALSGLTKRYVEDRFRVPRGRRPLLAAYRFAAAGMAVVVVLGLVQVYEVDTRAERARQVLETELSGGDPCFGAGSAVLGAKACPPEPGAAVVPELAVAGEDKSDAYPDGCFTGIPYDGRATCRYGNGSVKVALVGNSHAGQWLPALQRLAERNDWTITTYLISVCNASKAPLRLANAEQERNCAAYADWVLEETSGRAYDLVITSERQSVQVRGQDWPGTEREARKAYTDYLRRWARSGAKVVVLRDQVVPGREIGRVPECLARTDMDVEACSWPLRSPAPADPDAQRFMDPLYDAAKALDDPRVRWVDTHDLLCPEGTCRPVIGGVVTLFDASHYTATFAATTAPFLDERIRRATR
ncbi:MAG: acyltransferase [Actinobacteria bacterium]|nr:acyltransferase [Actinomycetota bacterium]